MYIDPQYLPTDPLEQPPEYDEDEIPDYALEEEDRINEILKDLEITDYDNIEKIINEPEVTPKKIRSFPYNKVLKFAKFRREQLKGYKSQVTHAYKKIKE